MASIATGLAASSSADRRMNNFDIIRLFAALQVMLMHSTSWLQLPLWDGLHRVLVGFAGVPIFFGVSGFLIS